jgi:hypothetical protein
MSSRQFYALGTQLWRSQLTTLNSRMWIIKVKSIYAVTGHASQLSFGLLRMTLSGVLRSP